MENKLTRNDIFKLVEPRTETEKEALDTAIERVGNNWADLNNAIVDMNLPMQTSEKLRTRIKELKRVDMRL